MWTMNTVQNMNVFVLVATAEQRDQLNISKSASIHVAFKSWAGPWPMFSVETRKSRKLIFLCIYP